MPQCQGHEDQSKQFKVGQDSVPTKWLESSLVREEGELTSHLGGDWIVSCHYPVLAKEKRQALLCCTIHNFSWWPSHFHDCHYHSGHHRHCLTLTGSCMYINLSNSFPPPPHLTHIGSSVCINSFNHYHLIVNGNYMRISMILSITPRQHYQYFHFAEEETEITENLAPWPW